MINERGLLNLRFLIALGGVLFLILATAYFFYGLEPNLASGESRNDSPSAAASVFKISKGEGLKEIGAHLSQGDFIKSITIFKLYSLFSGNAQKFKPGIYEINSGMSVPEIVKVLTAGGENEVTIVIPEGTALKDIDSVLAASGIIEKGSLVKYSFAALRPDYPFLNDVSSLEGFLFPDTYRFEVSSQTETVVKTMLDNFKVKVFINRPNRLV